MKKAVLYFILCLTVGIVFTGGCAGQKKEEVLTAESTADIRTDQVASSSEMSSSLEVGKEGMTPVTGKQLKDGMYNITVDSSSKMFQVTDCNLTVKDGKITAAMEMGGKGYLYVYPGTGEEASVAEKKNLIPYEELENGNHCFTIPVEALDQPLSCAAFSKNKEKWYDRTLVFRADSLPKEAYKEGTVATVKSLNLQDGEYIVDVKLSGGSGKATVETPAKLVVKDEKATVTLVWSSTNYDYMKVDGEKYDPVSTEKNTVFEIPVDGFDYQMAVSADTTAMSTPHEIDYTLYFDSSTIK